MFISSTRTYTIMSAFSMRLVCVLVLLLVITRPGIAQIVQEDSVQRLVRRIQTLANAPVKIPLSVTLYVADAMRAEVAKELVQSARIVAVPAQLQAAQGADSALKRIEQPFDSVRATIRRFSVDRPLPEFGDDFAPHPARPVHNAARALRTRVLRGVQNPVRAGLDTVVSDMMALGATQLLKRSPEEEWQKFVRLALNTPAEVEVARQYLTDIGRSALDAAVEAGDTVAARREENYRLVMQALQIEVRSALREPARLRERIGIGNSISHTQALETAAALNGAVQLAQRVGELEREATSEILQSQGAVNRLLEEFGQALTSSADPAKRRDRLDVIGEHAALTVLDAALRAPRSRDAVRRAAADAYDVVRGVDRLRQRAESIAQRQSDTFTAAEQYFREAQQLFGTLETTFKIPKATAAKVNTALQIGTQAANIAAGFSSGNYMGAAMGVLGLFGGFGSTPDPADSRHREVMETLAGMREQIDAVIKLQEVTLKQIGLLNAKVDSLSVSVARNHASVMAKLDSINQNVLWGAGVTVNPQAIEFQNCGQVAARVAAPRSYRRLTADFAQLVGTGHWADCRKALVTLGTDFTKGTIPALLWLNIAPGGDKNVLKYYERVQRPLLEYFRGPWRNAANVRASEHDLKLRGALAEPSLTYRHLLAKEFNLAKRSPPANVPSGLLQTPIQDSVAALFAQYALAIHPVYLFLNAAGDGLVDEATFYNPAAWPTIAVDTLSGEILLRRALMVVDEALAFQALMGGDVLLRDLAEQLHLPAKLDSLTMYNATLAENIARFAIYDAARKPVQSDVTALQYKAALPSAEKLKALFPRIRPSASSPSGVVNRELPFVQADSIAPVMLKVGSRSVPLPTVDEFEAGAFLSTLGLKRLLRVREALADAIAAYRVPHLLTATERAAAAYLAVQP